MRARQLNLSLTLILSVFYLARNYAHKITSMNPSPNIITESGKLFAISRWVIPAPINAAPITINASRVCSILIAPLLFTLSLFSFLYTFFALLFSAFFFRIGIIYGLTLFLFFQATICFSKIEYCRITIIFYFVFLSNAISFESRVPAKQKRLIFCFFSRIFFIKWKKPTRDIPLPYPPVSNASPVQWQFLRLSARLVPLQALWLSATPFLELFDAVP